jgi:Tfp pilus assembly protein PilN
VLRTNLSTHPFYNERAVHAVATVVALGVLAVTAWQVVRAVRLSRYKTELNTAIQRDRNETDYRTKEAAQIRRGLNQKELSVVAAAAKEANELIEQRTFSWTQLFNQLESTLPEDVMLTAVRPEFKDGGTQVNLEIQGRNSDANDAFWDRLEKTGAFHNIQWSAVNVTEDGLHRLQMKAVYTPPQPATRPASVVIPSPAPQAPRVAAPVGPPRSGPPRSPLAPKGATR